MATSTTGGDALSGAARHGGGHVRGRKLRALAYQQAEGGNLSKSGMKKSTKALIYIGIAVGFAASVWTIDHNVLDVTPSSLGTRQD